MDSSSFCSSAASIILLSDDSGKGDTSEPSPGLMPIFLSFTEFSSALTIAIFVAVFSSTSPCRLASNGVSSLCFFRNNFVAASTTAGDGFSTFPSSAKDSFVSSPACCTSLVDSFFDECDVQLLLGMGVRFFSTSIVSCVAPNFAQGTL